MADKALTEVATSTLKGVGKGTGAAAILGLSQAVGGVVVGNLIGAAIASAIFRDRADIICFVSGNNIAQSILGTSVEAAPGARVMVI